MTVMASSAVVRLYRARIQLFAVASVLLGVLLLVLNAATAVPEWLHAHLVEQIGGALVDLGAVTIVADYFLRSESDERSIERLDAALDRKLPGLLDAAIARNAASVTTAALAAFAADVATLRLLAPAVLRRLM